MTGAVAVSGGHEKGGVSSMPAASATPCERSAPWEIGMTPGAVDDLILQLLVILKRSAKL